ncbi:PEP-CTERM protein-sorting domain-containing protein [Arthrobacter sp. yr096]|uniref:hypothetical protein n=1 Tax=unclassified Arthrobacter TaxID=235627 RepID=UPI00089A35FE|nr:MULTISPECIES: hypothetical protein [unclassified Arthrobacter]SDW04259.1 PEP-CTERM protein-sorting domain-containing protein [Arthrobacter sp. cf158]SEI76909.1 PEP-CTERM protein-sorting domain-containing protein [Arthrobacter sp. yr096]
MRRVPDPLQIAVFFALAIVFATWQPLVWWRAAAAVLMLGFGCYGFYVLRRSKRQESSPEPDELESRGR